LGQIQNFEQKKTEYRLEQIKLKKLQRDLASLERVIMMHELATECGPGNAIRFSQYRTALPYGKLTEYILKYLELSQGQARTAKELAVYVNLRGNVNIPEGEFSRFRKLVRSRLKNLLAIGRVVRKPPLQGSQESRWGLPIGSKGDRHVDSNGKTSSAMEGDPAGSLSGGDCPDSNGATNATIQPDQPA
jgi:hypothetical protein